MTTQPDHIEINPGKADGGPWVKINGHKANLIGNYGISGLGGGDEVPRATLTFLTPKVTIYSEIGKGKPEPESQEHSDEERPGPHYETPPVITGWTYQH